MLERIAEDGEDPVLPPITRSLPHQAIRRGVGQLGEVVVGLTVAFEIATEGVAHFGRFPHAAGILAKHKDLLRATEIGDARPVMARHRRE